MVSTDEGRKERKLKKKEKRRKLRAAAEGRDEIMGFGRALRVREKAVKGIS